MALSTIPESPGLEQVVDTKAQEPGHHNAEDAQQHPNGNSEPGAEDDQDMIDLLVANEAKSVHSQVVHDLATDMLLPARPRTAETGEQYTFASQPSAHAPAQQPAGMSNTASQGNAPQAADTPVIGLPIRGQDRHFENQIPPQDGHPSKSKDLRCNTESRSTLHPNQAAPDVRSTKVGADAGKIRKRRKKKSLPPSIVQTKDLEQASHDKAFCPGPAQDGLNRTSPKAIIEESLPHEDRPVQNREHDNPEIEVGGAEAQDGNDNSDLKVMQGTLNEAGHQDASLVPEQGRQQTQASEVGIPTSAQPGRPTLVGRHPGKKSRAGGGRGVVRYSHAHQAGAAASNNAGPGYVDVQNTAQDNLAVQDQPEAKQMQLMSARSQHHANARLQGNQASLGMHQKAPTVDQVLAVLPIALQKERAEATRALHAKCAEVERLRGQYDSLRDQCNHLIHENDQLVSQDERTSAELHACKEKFSKVQRSFRKLDDAVKELRAINQTLTAQKLELHAHAASTKDELKIAKEANDATINEFGQWKIKVRAEIGAARDQLHALEQEKTGLLASAQLKQEQLETMTRDRDQIKAQMEQREKDSEHIGSLLENNHDSIQGRFKELLEACEKRENPDATQQLSELFAKLHELDTKAPAASLEVQQAVMKLQSELLARIDQLEQAAKVASEDDHTASRVMDQKFSEHLGRMKDELIESQALQQQIASLKEEKATFVEQLKSREIRITQLEQRVGAAEFQHATLQKDNAALHEQLQAHTAAAASASAEVEQQIRENEVALTAELEKCRAELLTKDEDVSSLQETIGSMKQEHDVELKNLRHNLSKESERVRKDDKAEFENKIRALENKYKTQQQAEGSAPSAFRRGRLAQSVAQITQADHEAQMAALRQEYETKQLSSHTEHENAVARLQQEHETTIAERVKLIESEAESKARDTEKKLGEKHQRETQELKKQLSEAKAAQESATQELAQATRTAKEWKRKCEDIQADKTMTQLLDMSDDEPPEEEDEERYVEVHKISTVSAFKPGHQVKGPSRAINRADTARSQTPNSMIFEDDLEDQENRSPSGEEALPGARRSNKSSMTGPTVQELKRSLGMRPTQQRDSDSPLPSSPTPSSGFQIVNANMVRRSQELPRANSSQRMMSPLTVNPRHLQAPAANYRSLSGYFNKPGAQQSMQKLPGSDGLELSSPLQHAGTMRTYGRHVPPGNQAAGLKPAAKLLVKDSQDESRKRAASPTQSHASTHKRSRTNASSVIGAPPKANAFTQHNELQRAKSREGLASRSSMMKGTANRLSGVPLASGKHGATQSAGRPTVPASKSGKQPKSTARARSIKTKQKNDEREMEKTFDTAVRHSARIQSFHKKVDYTDQV